MNLYLKSCFKSFKKAVNKKLFLLRNVLQLDIEIFENVLGDFIGKGTYGSVYNSSRNSKRVYKVIGKGFTTNELKEMRLLGLNNYIAKKQVISLSMDYIDCFIEAYNLFVAQKTKITPKFYNFIFIRKNNKYFPAIEMEKIEGVSMLNLIGLKHFTLNATPQGKLAIGFYDKLKDHINVNTFVNLRLSKVNLKHKDLNLNNIILNKESKIKIIDFSTQYIGHKKRSRYMIFMAYGEKVGTYDGKKYEKLKIDSY